MFFNILKSESEYTDDNKDSVIIYEFNFSDVYDDLLEIHVSKVDGRYIISDNGIVINTYISNNIIMADVVEEYFRKIVKNGHYSNGEYCLFSTESKLDKDIIMFLQFLILVSN